MGKSLTTAHDPQAIGALFRKARSSHLDSVKYLLAIGKALIEIKADTDHGSWMLWLKHNEKDLGFKDDTARRLMRLANQESTLNLDSVSDAEALKISRQTWGNSPPPKVEIEIHGVEYRQLVRMAEWMKSHPAWTVNSCLSRDEASELREALETSRLWFESLQRAIATLPGSNGRLIENAKAN